jgi:hypothetical protein
MDQNKLQFWLTIAGLVVQALLAIFALWYTIETRQLRKHSVLQLAVLHRQHLLAVSPYLTVGLFGKKEIIRDLETNPKEVLSIEDPEELKKQAKAELEKLKSAESEFFLCSLSNPTSKLALSVEAFVYNQKSKNFVESVNGASVIEEKGDANIHVAGDSLSQEEAIAKARQTYGDFTEIDKNLFNHSADSYVIVFFRDIENGVYAIKREFFLDDENVIQHSRPNFYSFS